MTEQQQFLAMLQRAWIGHGTRTDYNPPGTGVQVEDEDEAHLGAEFWFDAEGKLKSVKISDQVEQG